MLLTEDRLLVHYLLSSEECIDTLKKLIFLDELF